MNDQKVEICSVRCALQKGVVQVGEQVRYWVSGIRRCLEVYELDSKAGIIIGEVTLGSVTQEVELGPGVRLVLGGC